MTYRSRWLCDIVRPRRCGDSRICQDDLVAGAEVQDLQPRALLFLEGIPPRHAVSEAHCHQFDATSHGEFGVQDEARIARAIFVWMACRCASQAS